MRHNDLEDSEVFNAFMKIATDEGLLDKKPEYLYPDYDLSVRSHELDFPITAMATRDTGLYGVMKDTAESMVNDAHGKGPMISDLQTKPQGDLAKVETVVEQHKVNQGIALKMPTGKLAQLATRLMALAAELDNAGFTKAADAIDLGLTKLARDIDKELLDQQQGYRASLDNISEVPENPDLKNLEFSRTDTKPAQQSATDVQMNNQAIQGLINTWREQAGQPAIAVSGRMDQAFSDALNDLGVSPGSYHTWQELQSKINAAGPTYVKKHKAQAPADATTKPAEGFKGLPTGTLAPLPAAPAGLTNKQLS